MINRLEGFFADLPVDFCGDCRLWEECENSCMNLTGEGRRSVLVVGEAPGKEEDKTGVQFVGPSGKLLRGVLDKLGWDLDRDCWKTNAVRCFPSKTGTPDNRQVDACRSKLLGDIRECEPRVILLLGAVAVRSVVGLFWRGDVGSISRWVGWKIPCREWNCWLCPTYHPSYLLRANNPVLNLIFERHVREALDLGGRPFKDEEIHRRLEDEIECIYESGRVGRVLEQFVRDGGAVALDFETDRLKPDGEGACILSAAVCWRGRRTVAFPVVGEAVDGLRRLLRSDLPKIGWSIKFEDRWARKVLGVEVRNWVWDGMVAAHVLDNRPDITGLKFQSFVLLGVEPWDFGVLDNKEADSGNSSNLMDRVNLGDLLIYNGMDALCTYRVALVQRRCFRRGELL